MWVVGGFVGVVGWWDEGLMIGCGDYWGRVWV